MLNRLTLRIFFTIVTVILGFSSLSGQSNIAQQTSDRTQQLLENPRRAIHTFLHWQQEGHERPELVAETMQLYDGNTQQKVERAEKLRQVLDSRGLLVEYDKVPNDPAYIDSLSGLHQYILFSSLPEVYLVRNDGQWMFSKSTINKIPELYNTTFSPFVRLVIDRLPDSFHQQWMGFKAWQYIAIFVWLLLGFVIGKIFEFFFDRYARRLVDHSQTLWDDKLIQEIERPISFLITILFFWSTFTNLRFSVSINYYLSTTLEVLVSGSFIWLFYNLSNVFSDYLMHLTSKTESKLDDQLVPLLRKTLKVFVVVIGVIFILQNNGINVASLLAGLGLGGLAFALAARDTLANFFGSLTIFLDQPFQIGDWIKTDQVEGTVEEVGFRSTLIRTFHNSVVSIPNSILANTEVDNLGLREYRRLKMMLNLTYSTTPEQMEAFVEGIKAIIKANDNIRQDFYEVHFNEYGAHSLDVLVYIFFDVETWSEELQQRHNFLLEVYRLAEEIGVEFAFPTKTIHVDSFYKDTPREVGEKRSDDELATAVYAFGPDGELAKPEGIKLKKEGKEVTFDVGSG